MLGILLDSQKWHDSLDRKWMRPRNVGAARATLTREDSEWSWKFEEPWQSRPRDWRGVGQFFLRGRVKGLAKSLQRGRVEMLSKHTSLKTTLQNATRIGNEDMT